MQNILFREIKFNRMQYYKGNSSDIFRMCNPKPHIGYK